MIPLTLAEIEVTTDQLITAAGGGLAAWLLFGRRIMAIIRQIMAMFNGENLPVAGESANSDKPAPDGFAEHVQTVLNASPSADPETRCDYLCKALTEAQVLRSEVERLGGK